MTDSRDLQLSAYDYRLPDERIAQRPVQPRHAARLLIVPALEESSSQVRHATVWDWQHELQPGDLLVVNDTRSCRPVCVCGAPEADWVVLVLEPG